MHRPLSVAVLLVLLATAPANPQQTQWFSQRTRDRIQAALSLAQWIPNLNTAAKILKTIMDVGVEVDSELHVPPDQINAEALNRLTAKVTQLEGLKRDLQQNLAAVNAR